MPWRKPLIGLSLIIGITISMILLAVANWPPLVRNTCFCLIEDGFSTLVVGALARVAPVRPVTPGIGYPPAGRLAVFEPAELVRLWQSGWCPPRGAFTILEIGRAHV